MTLHARLDAPPPRIPAHLEPLLTAEAPRFSGAELARRRSALAAALAEADVDHALLMGGDKRGSALQWLTGWPANTNSNLAIFTPGERDVLLVPYPNHVPQAQVLAPDCEVIWRAEGSTAVAMDILSKRAAPGNGGRKVGIVGNCGVAFVERLAKLGLQAIDLTRAYAKLRLIKSDEEIDWLRIGCALSDLGLEGLARDVRPGMNEHELATLIERAYLPWGGMTQIHFLGLTSMANPDCCVPSQLPRNREVKAGDVIFTEIACSFWSYPGQVLRTFAVEAEPTPLYRELYAAAEETFAAVTQVLRPGATPRDVLEAAKCLDGTGFTICDDLVHGYVGGYLQPILGTYERPSGPVPDMVFQENMTMVVQPSVVTRDSKAGVQTGELVRITKTGFESLHHAPPGFRRVGA
ncbi:MAG TPA: M24 family metallopeptidase [Alphaproteobacteria bacterium]|jgi:Xaa-Pro aminopeptidase